MPPAKKQPKKGGRKLTEKWALYVHLVDEMSTRRKRLGVTQEAVALDAGVSDGAISRQENYYRGSDDLDRLVAAYAKHLQCEPVELWLGAIARWIESEKHVLSRQQAAKMRAAFRRAQGDG